jgi:hypothetical protein
MAFILDRLDSISNIKYETYGGTYALFTNFKSIMFLFYNKKTQFIDIAFCKVPTYIQNISLYIFVDVMLVNLHLFPCLLKIRLRLGLERIPSFFFANIANIAKAEVLQMAHM